MPAATEPLGRTQVLNQRSTETISKVLDTVRARGTTSPRLLTRRLVTFARLRPSQEPPAFSGEQMHPAPVTGAVQDAEMLEAEAIGEFVARVPGNTLFF